MSVLPAWILWISPVVVAPSLAVVWNAWASRPRGPVEPLVSVQRHDAFRAALQAPVPQPRAPRPSRSRSRASR